MTKKTKDKINFEKRKFQTAPLSKVMPSVLKLIGGAAEAKKAASLIRVINHWADIVGADIAAKSMPLKITFKKQKNRETGEQETIRVLKLKAEGALVTTIAMRENIFCQRLNTLFGCDDFKKLNIEHGFQSTPQRHKAPDKTVRHDLNLPDIDDPVLKERLESLGQAVMNSADADS